VAATHAVPPLLTDLAVVLGTAAVVSALFHRLRVPPVLGYVIAGLLVGPHVPVPLVANQENVQTLSDLGVILLMYTVGLEFNARKLLRAGPRGLLAVSVQGGVMFTLALLAARAFGWGETAAVFVGSSLCISSTMIAARLVESTGPPAAVRESVFSILVMQDLLAILLLTGLATASGAGGVRMAELGATLLRLLLFAGLLLALGLLLVPRFVRWVADTQGDEALLVLSVGLCFALAYTAARFGYSPALGAFLGGTLVSESGRAARVEGLVLPLRDLFSAVFFVSAGMRIDPGPLPGLVVPVLVLSLLVLGLTPFLVGAASALGGRPFRSGFRTGLLLGQIGEFSFIILGAGLAAGAIGSEVFAAVAGVAVLTLLGASLLARHGETLAEQAYGWIPVPLRNRMDDYQAWIAGFDVRRTRGILPSRIRRPLALLALETACLVAFLALSYQLAVRLGLRLEQHEHLEHRAAMVTAWAGIAALAALLGWVVHQGSRRIAEHWLDTPGGDPAPRRDVGRRRFFQALVLLALGLPAGAVLQPFLPALAGPAVLAGLLVLLGVLLASAARRS